MFRMMTVALLVAAAVQAQNRVPVVVELFTSEGCSSCPAADSLLAELQTRQLNPKIDIIALSEHVDYWNSLGWKDPFSAATFSERQQTYAELLHSSDVYTPQAVIDGRFATVGSNRQNVLKAIASSGESAKPELRITVTRQGNALLVDAEPSEKGNLWVAITQARAVSHVVHGENAGRTLEHVGVVRSLTKLKAGQARIDIDRNWNSDLSVVAFVQDGHTGRILQATEKKI
jgi:hypothetical protein